MVSLSRQLGYKEPEDWSGLFKHLLQQDWSLIPNGSHHWTGISGGKPQNFFPGGPTWDSLVWSLQFHQGLPKVPFGLGILGKNSQFPPFLGYPSGGRVHIPFWGSNFPFGGFPNPFQGFGQVGGTQDLTDLPGILLPNGGETSERHGVFYPTRRDSNTVRFPHFPPPWAKPLGCTPPFPFVDTFNRPIFTTFFNRIENTLSHFTHQLFSPVKTGPRPQNTRGTFFTLISILSPLLQGHPPPSFHLYSWGQSEQRGWGKGAKNAQQGAPQVLRVGPGFGPLGDNSDIAPNFGATSLGEHSGTI